MNKYESAIHSSKYYLGSGSMPSIPLPDSILQTRYNLVNQSSSKGFNGNLPNIFSAAGQAQFIRKPQAVIPQEDLKDWLIGKAPEPGSIGQSVQMFLNQSIKPSISFNYSSMTQPNTNKLEAIRINQAPNNLTSNINNLDNNNNQVKEEEQQQRASGVGRRLRRIKSDIIINLNPKEDSNFKQNKEPIITSLSHINFDKNSIQQQAQEQQDKEDEINYKVTRKGRKTQSLIPSSSSFSEDKFKIVSTLQMSSPAPRLKPITVFAPSTQLQTSPLQTLKDSSPNSEIANETHAIMNTSHHKLNKLFSSSNTLSPQINPSHKTISSKQSLLKDLQNITDSRKLLDMQLSSQNSPYSTAEQSPTEDTFSRSSSTHLCLPKIQTRPKNISSIFRHQDFSPETQILQNSHNFQGKEEESNQLQQFDFEQTNKPAEPKIIRLSQKPKKQLDAFLSSQQPDRNSPVSNNPTPSTIPKVMFLDDSTKASASDIFYTTKSAIFSQVWDQTDSPLEKTPNGRPKSRATRGILKNMTSPTAMRKKQVIFDKNLKVYELSQQL